MLLDHDLSYQSLTFTPNESLSLYRLCSSDLVTEFPTDPNGGTPLLLGDDDYEELILAGGSEVSFYGELYSSFFVGSNGYITFLTGDTSYTESLNNHFEFKRISALFDDLSPNAGGEVSWKQLLDRVAVTFENLPGYQESNSNNFQVELFFNGVIRITYLQIETSDGLAGLSIGEGLPEHFSESDLSEFLCNIPCDFEPDGDVDMADLHFFISFWQESNCDVLVGDESDWCFGTDLSRNGNVNLEDFAILAKYWLESVTP